MQFSNIFSHSALKMPSVVGCDQNLNLVFVKIAGIENESVAEEVSIADIFGVSENDDNTDCIDDVFNKENILDLLQVLDLTCPLALCYCSDMLVKYIDPFTQ